MKATDQQISDWAARHGLNGHITDLRCAFEDAQTLDVAERHAGGDTYPPPSDHFFGLSYASYMVPPRLALQAMPQTWQREFFALVEELHDVVGPTPDNYVVMRRDRSGRLHSGDPWSNYRRGSIAEAKAADAEKAA